MDWTWALFGKPGKGGISGPGLKMDLNANIGLTFSYVRHGDGRMVGQSWHKWAFRLSQGTPWQISRDLEQSKDHYEDWEKPTYGRWYATRIPQDDNRLRPRINAPKTVPELPPSNFHSRITEGRLINQVWSYLGRTPLLFQSYLVPEVERSPSQSKGKERCTTFTLSEPLLLSRTPFAQIPSLLSR